jgi:putative transposase
LEDYFFSQMCERFFTLSRVYPYLGGIVRGEGGHLLAIGGTDDHVHLLVVLPAAGAVADAVQRVKGRSSLWINDQRLLPAKFGWQRGYGAFTVSHSAVPRVRRYIAEQEAHHRKMTFQEEFVQLLDRHGVAYDARYLWA